MTALFLFVWLLCFSTCRSLVSKRYAIQVPGGEEVAKRIASELGLEFIKRVTTNDDYYVLMERDEYRYSKRDFEKKDIQSLLNKRSEVVWAKRQEIKQLSKRGFEQPIPDNLFNDPLYPEEWYINGDGYENVATTASLRVKEAWELGYDGTGVKIVVIDDGIDGTHADLNPNYLPSHSIDLNDNDDDPYPRIKKPYDEYNAHGTKCAGEIAAVANNGICGVGIAFNAKIGGIRMLDGKVTDDLEATAFSYKCEDVDIFSMSWGPNDDGKTFGGFYRMSQAAIEHCIKHGRGGKGTIYVWASGNGGAKGDDCNADGYVSSPYTISIGALTSTGRPAYFQETCASTLGTVYTGGISRQQYEQLKANHNKTIPKMYPMVTTNIAFDSDIHSSKNCEKYFSGTSAAGPLGAGIIALTLQANPSLTWRDVQYIIIEAARLPDLSQSDDEIQWHKNGAGHQVNHDYGFGILNAEKMVTLAKTWITVPKLHKCRITYSNELPKPIPSSEGEWRELKLTTTGCGGKLRYLEYVSANVSYNSEYRGAINLKLHSPSGTVSQLMRTRPLDKSKDPLSYWSFNSVLFWGENPFGEWTLSIAYDKEVVDKAKLSSFSPTISSYGLELSGTTTAHSNPSNAIYSETDFNTREDEMAREFYKKEMESSISDSNYLDPRNDVYNLKRQEEGILDDFLDKSHLTKSGYIERHSEADNLLKQSNHIKLKNNAVNENHSRGTLIDFEDKSHLTMSGFIERHPNKRPTKKRAGLMFGVSKRIASQEEFGGKKTVFVGNLPYQATEDDLKRLFSDYGVVNHVNIAYDRETGIPRGFAFVEFQDEYSVAAALDSQGLEFEGRLLEINVGRSPSESPRRPNRGRERKTHSYGSSNPYDERYGY